MKKKVKKVKKKAKKKAKKSADRLPAHIPNLRIEVSDTSQGNRDYVQVMSGDQLTVNLVLIADEVQIRDFRSNPQEHS